MTRQEQRIEDTWNMQDLYETEELYAKEKERLEEMMKSFGAFSGTLDQGAEQLLRMLKQYEEMGWLFERLYVYANQKYHEDTGNGKYQKMSGEAQILGAKLEQCTSWVEPELLALPQEKLEGYFNAGAEKKTEAGDSMTEAEKELGGYRRFVEQITRMKEHVLDASMEALMARAGEMGQAPSNIFSMFNNADIRFPEITGADGKKHELTVGTYISYLESRDRTLRRDAFEKLYGVYGQFRNTLAAAYYGNAKQADFFAKEHRYASAMEQALDGSAVPLSVYENLVRTINDRLPLMHRYVKLRKRLLGVEELHMYDVYVPMVEKADKAYSFEEAKEIVKRGLAPLGEEYLALLREGFDNRWIDVYENQGKRTGAYSWGAYGTHPYVLLNYHGSLDNVFTLAHEMGHALHSWHSDHAQPFRYAGYKTFVAEVASTCNEALLIHDLLGRTEDPAEKNYLINHFLDQFKGTVYRQTMFAEFEMETHRMVERGEMLTAEILCELYYELNKRYFGPDMVVDREIACEWERIPHFYNPFYVYQYATGFSAAIAISSKILKGEPGILEKYKRFLSGGSSQDPIDLLRICGVDMASPEPVRQALDVFEEYLSVLEQN